MRKLMRILVGVAMLASLALVAPPAHADHGGTAEPKKNWPMDDEPEFDPAQHFHENPPTIPDNFIPPDAACIVSGGVDIVPNYTEGGPQHYLNLYGPINPAGGDLADLENELNEPTKGDPPVAVGGYSADPITRNLWNNPSHSHYVFNEVLIQCLSLTLGPLNFAVTATGGNDGHFLNIWNDPLSEGCSVSLPAIGGKKDNSTAPTPGPKKDESDPCIGGPQTDPHAHNSHHGSVNESAWSNSSLFAENWGDFHGAPPPFPNHTNKGFITATEAGETVANTGWVSYVRVGPAVIAWGEFLTGPVDLQGKFLTALAFFPDPTETLGEFGLAGVAVLY